MHVSVTVNASSAHVIYVVSECRWRVRDKDVNLPPYSSMTSCGNLPLFKDGKGCGSCYEVLQTMQVLLRFPDRSYEIAR
jgi:hypothetical protein